MVTPWALESTAISIPGSSTYGIEINLTLSLTHPGSPCWFCWWYWSAVHQWSASVGICRFWSACLVSSVPWERIWPSPWSTAQSTGVHLHLKATFHGSLFVFYSKYAIQYALPFSLGEFVVFAVLVIWVKVDNALNKVLIEHLRVLLQKPIHQTVFTQTIENRDSVIFLLCWEGWNNQQDKRR